MTTTMVQIGIMNFKHDRLLFLMYTDKNKNIKKRNMRWPGVEHGSIAWRAAMISVTLPTPVATSRATSDIYSFFFYLNSR